MERTLVILALVSFVATSASADDLQIGTTKSSGMAGAGLALRSNKGSGSPKNPALYALRASPRRCRTQP